MKHVTFLHWTLTQDGPSSRLHENPQDRTVQLSWTGNYRDGVPRAPTEDCGESVNHFVREKHVNSAYVRDIFAMWDEFTPTQGTSTRNVRSCGSSDSGQNRCGYLSQHDLMRVGRTAVVTYHNMISWQWAEPLWLLVTTWSLDSRQNRCGYYHSMISWQWAEPLWLLVTTWSLESGQNRCGYSQNSVSHNISRRAN
jgi:hypothetical protein